MDKKEIINNTFEKEIIPKSDIIDRIINLAQEINSLQTEMDGLSRLLEKVYNTTFEKEYEQYED